MKKILVVDSSDMSVKSISASVSVHTRFAYLLSQLLESDFVFSTELSFRTSRITTKKYDTIVFVYASGYCELTWMLDYFAKNHRDAEYFFVLNEYSLAENPILRELGKQYGIKYTVISNYYSEDDSFFRVCRQRIKDVHVVNLNVMIYDGLLQDDRAKGFLFDYKQKNKVPILYYGMFRPDRVLYYKKYFTKDFYVSTSRKNMMKYSNAGIDCKLVPPIKWKGNGQRLFDVKASLYIEDVFTHTNYNYLANRFYECLMHNVPLFYDKSCLSTIKKSGYEIDNYFIVDNKKELLSKVESINDFSYPLSFYSRAAKEKSDLIIKLKQVILGEINNEN